MLFEGPIVIIAPDEASLADVDAVRTIYKVGGPYHKTKWYGACWGDSPEQNAFTMIDPKVHARNRQVTSYYFSEKYIAQLEPYIAANVGLAIRRMKAEMDAQGFVDVLKCLFFMVTL